MSISSYGRKLKNLGDDDIPNDPDNIDYFRAADDSPPAVVCYLRLDGER